MKNQQKTVFITGATGTMGMETLKQFLSRQDRFKLKLLIHDTKIDRKIIAPYRKNKNIEIVYGDLRDADVIERCVCGVDYVLHVGAMVSPAADKYPEETMKVNFGSTVKIIEAVKKQDNPDEIALVFIGTIAQTGCRRDPIHWGRIGDPIKSSMFDYYAVSKIAAERSVFESGLKKWVSIRQTGMLPAVNRPHPIVFHQNFNNVLEWSTAEESGLLMANICEAWIPDNFWRKAYNVGGGEKWRLTLWQYLEIMFGAMGVDYKAVFDPRDFAIYNFHGHWFTDSDVLNDITKYRFLDPERFFNKELRRLQIIKSIPLIRRFIPSANTLHQQMAEVNCEHSGTQWMFENNQEAWIKSFFGSRKKHNQIKSWDEGYELYVPEKTPTYLDHGYDENKPVLELDLEDMRQAAQFRGGQCLSSSMVMGDLFSPLKWQCYLNHEFEATPNLILKGGHWCSECERTSWNHAEIAKHSPFFAQVWTPIHGDDDGVVVTKAFSDLTCSNQCNFRAGG